VIDRENAFNPENTHLWVRCKAHKDGIDHLFDGLTGYFVPEKCIFVVNCPECQENCLHDYPFSDTEFSRNHREAYDLP
jgi:hypothetical protein